MPFSDIRLKYFFATSLLKFKSLVVSLKLRHQPVHRSLGVFFRETKGRSHRAWLTAKHAQPSSVAVEVWRPLKFSCGRDWEEFNLPEVNASPSRLIYVKCLAEIEFWGHNFFWQLSSRNFTENPKPCFCGSHQGKNFQWTSSISFIGPEFSATPQSAEWRKVAAAAAQLAVKWGKLSQQ